MKQYLIRSLVTALVFIGLTVAFDAIFNEMGSIWKYLFAGVLFGFAYEGWYHFYQKGAFSKNKKTDSFRDKESNH